MLHRAVLAFGAARYGAGVGEAEAGLKLYCSRTGAQMTVNYGGAFGESTSQHQVKAELAYKIGGGGPAGFPPPADCY